MRFWKRSQHWNWTIGGAVALTALLAAWSASPVSSVAPRRFALAIGIENYPGGPDARLPGCVLDARNFRQMLTARLGFANEEVAMLLDTQATRAGILAAIEAARQRAGRGDLFVLYYSGHGSVFPDRLSDEHDETQVITPIGGQNRPMPADRYDVALCPVDVDGQSSGKRWGNLILDDELYAAFSRFTAQGCQVVFVSDSCFSGTLARGFGDDRVPKYLPPDRFLKNLAEDAARSVPLAMSEKAPDLQGRYLTFGSSSDTQTSGATPKGSLFTLALNAVLAENPRQSYRQIHARVKDLVLRDSEREQEPQLDTRFFGGSVEEPFLSLPASSAAPPVTSREMAIGILVTDLQNRPLPGTALGIFPAGTPMAAGRIRVGQALLTGVTDGKGEFRSSESLAPGPYRIKLVHKTHRAFESDVEIRESRGKPGTALIYVRLTPES